MPPLWMPERSNHFVLHLIERQTDVGNHVRAYGQKAP
jgi:hypothetical protein